MFFTMSASLEIWNMKQFKMPCTTQKNGKNVIGGAKMCQIVTKQLYYSLFPTLRMTFYLFDIIIEKILCEKIIDCQIDM